MMNLLSHLTSGKVLYLVLAVLLIVFVCHVKTDLIENKRIERLIVDTVDVVINENTNH